MMSSLEQTVEYGVCPHAWGVCEECQARVDAYLDGRNAAWAEGYRAQALAEESRYHATAEV